MMLSVERSDPALTVLDRVDELAVPFFRQWLAEDPDHQRAAGEYYAVRLARGRLLLDNEKALSAYCAGRFDPAKCVFVEMGTGFGELSLMLGLRGFRVTGFESSQGRYAGASALVKELGAHGIVAPGLSLVSGALPSALTFDLLAGRDESIFVSTNVTSSHVMENIEAVHRSLRLFDHLVVDVARFGAVREEEGKRTLIEELIRSGFVQVAVIHYDSGSDIRHFTRRSSPAASRPDEAPRPVEPETYLPLRSADSPVFGSELCGVEALNQLLLPPLKHQVEKFGDRQTGIYDFYRGRLATNTLLQHYEVAVATRLVARRDLITHIDEVGSGLGQLVFLLGWNGFQARGIEADVARASMARRLRKILEMTDPELTSHIDLLEADFPGDIAPLGGKSLVLCTNLVVSRTPEQQAEIIRAMRRYVYAIVDIQRLFVHRNDAESQAAALALFADAGFGSPQLFLDLGTSGRYMLFENDR